MANPYGVGGDEDLIERATGFWGRVHPGIRSGVLLWALFVAIALMHSLTGGSSAAICYPIQILLYIGNGVLAAYMALGSGFDQTDLPRVGAVAGMVAWVLPAFFYLVFVVILGMATLGIGFVGIATWVLCGPVDLAIQIGCGSLGAWGYGNFTGGTGAPHESDSYDYY